jgi:hypothetical protein
VGNACERRRACKDGTCRKNTHRRAWRMKRQHRCCGQRHIVLRRHRAVWRRRRRHDQSCAGKSASALRNAHHDKQRPHHTLARTCIRRHVHRRRKRRNLRRGGQGKTINWYRRSVGSAQRCNTSCVGSANRHVARRWRLQPLASSRTGWYRRERLWQDTRRRWSRRQSRHRCVHERLLRHDQPCHRQQRHESSRLGSLQRCECRLAWKQRHNPARWWWWGLRAWHRRCEPRHPHTLLPDSLPIRRLAERVEAASERSGRCWARWR